MQWCRELGADEVIDHRGDLVAQLKQKGIAGVSFALMTNSPDAHFPALAEAVLPQGLIASILSFTTPDLLEQHQILTRVSGLVDSKVLRATANETIGPINAANLKRAQGRIESGTAIGKVVLEGF
jgi:NADPH:quinone reductase-like Zn-dependent oxidoreductase